MNAALTCIHDWSLNYKYELNKAPKKGKKEPKHTSIEIHSD